MQFFLVYSTFTSWSHTPRRSPKIFPTLEEATKHASNLTEDESRSSVWIEKFEIGKTELLFLLLAHSVDAASSIIDTEREKFKIEKIEVK